MTLDPLAELLGQMLHEWDWGCVAPVPKRPGFCAEWLREHRTELLEALGGSQCRQPDDGTSMSLSWIADDGTVWLFPDGGVS